MKETKKLTVKELLTLNGGSLTVMWMILPPDFFQFTIRNWTFSRS